MVKPFQFVHDFIRTGLVIQCIMKGLDCKTTEAMWAKGGLEQDVVLGVVE